MSMSHREREKLFRTKRPVKEKARCLRTFLHMNISSSSNRTCIMSSPMANEQNDGPFEWQREIILQELDAEASVEGKHNAVMLCLKHRQTDTQTHRQTDRGREKLLPESNYLEPTTCFRSSTSAGFFKSSLKRLGPEGFRRSKCLLSLLLLLLLLLSLLCIEKLARGIDVTE